MILHTSTRGGGQPLRAPLPLLIAVALLSSAAPSAGQSSTCVVSDGTLLSGLAVHTEGFVTSVFRPGDAVDALQGWNLAPAFTFTVLSTNGRDLDLRCLAADPVASGTIETVAGQGRTGDVGDGGPALAAELARPYTLLAAPDGSVFIGELDNHRVRRVDPSGVITTVAGTGELGSSGDGGPATEAQLRTPVALALDAMGNLYIAEWLGQRVRRVDPMGVITTVAGTGQRGFSGDGGPAAQAQLFAPVGLALDGAGNLYIADRLNARIRRVDLSGVITTIVGTGERSFGGDGGPATEATMSSPWGLALDGMGNLYIADRFDHRIRRVDPSGTITTVAGTGERGSGGDGGPATEAQLNSPYGVALDPAGNLYIADRSNRRVRRVDPAGTIETVVGSGDWGFSGDGGPATAARLVVATAVAVGHDGSLYVADEFNHRVRQVRDGTISTIAGPRTASLADTVPAANARLYRPGSVAVDGAGNVFLADLLNHVIRRVDPSGVMTTVAGTGERGFGGDGGPATEAQLHNPEGVALDLAGNLYIADWDNNRIRRVDPSGTITTVAGTGERFFGGDGGPATEAQLRSPQGVAVGPAGDLYIVDRSNHRIRRVDPSGVITTVAGSAERGFGGDGGPATEAQLFFPYSVALDPAGNLYIADRNNHRIRRVDPSGTITTVAGTGERGFGGDGGPATAARLAFPYGVAVGPAGDLYIADRSNRRIRRVDPSGTITTVAGTGAWAFGGDGGPAAASSLDPSAIAFDSDGNLYIADAFNDRIRRVRVD